MYNFRLKIGLTGTRGRVISRVTKKFLGHSILGGLLFRAVWRRKRSKGLKVPLLLVSNSKVVTKNDGSAIFANQTVTSILKKRLFRRVSRFGFFFNFRNNKKFNKKYRVVL